MFTKKHCCKIFPSQKWAAAICPRAGQIYRCWHIWSVWQSEVMKNLSLSAKHINSYKSKLRQGKRKDMQQNGKTWSVSTDHRTGLCPWYFCKWSTDGSAEDLYSKRISPLSEYSMTIRKYFLVQYNTQFNHRCPRTSRCFSMLDTDYKVFAYRHR